MSSYAAAARRQQVAFFSPRRQRAAILTLRRPGTDKQKPDWRRACLMIHALFRRDISGFDHLRVFLDLASEILRQLFRRAADRISALPGDELANIGRIERFDDLRIQLHDDLPRST